MLISFAVEAQTARLDRVEIVEAGTYKLAANGSVAVAGLSTTVAANLGVQFGFRYIPVGEPRGGAVALRLVTRLPGQGARNPANGQIVARTEEAVSAVMGAPLVSGYKFDAAWEMVPGVWTFEIWDRERKMAEQRFTVVKR